LLLTYEHGMLLTSEHGMHNVTFGLWMFCAFQSKNKEFVRRCWEC